MKLQKHEREVVLYAREAAPHLTVEMVPCGKSKRRLVLTGPRGSQSIVIASSPKNRDHAVVNNKRWIDKTIPTVS